MNAQTEKYLIEQGCVVLTDLQLKLSAAMNAYNGDFDYAQFEQCLIHINNWYRAFRKSTRIATALEVKILELNDRMHDLNRIKKSPNKIKTNLIAQFFGSNNQASVGLAPIKFLDNLSRIKLLTMKITDDLKKTPVQPALHPQEKMFINSYQKAPFDHTHRPVMGSL